MADWKVSAERIEIFPHPDPKAIRLEVAKIGMFALVVGKDNGYKTGDIVVFAPKRSVLPEDLRSHYINFDTGESYLIGLNKDRVTSRRMLKELSEGITIDMDWVLSKLGLESADQLVLGEDLSARLGISLYDPPVPSNFAGKCAKYPVEIYTQHDVESLTLYGSEFTAGERVYMSEKIHGSQLALTVDEIGNAYVSSKGLFRQGIMLIEDARNIYWRALRNNGVIDLIKEILPGRFVQLYAEVVPAQKGFNYGMDPNRPGLLVYRLEVDRVRLSIHMAKALHSRIAELWVPILYDGPFDDKVLRSLAKGMETVSGKSLHIREGGVVEPFEPRDSREGFALYVKVINPQYKDKDDDLS